MVSLYSLIIFFFILVVFYSAVTLALSISAWFQRWVARRQVSAHAALRQIENRTDHMKQKAFNISVVLVLFCITPFVIIYLMVFR